MRITIAAAADRDWGIGLEGRLPWHCPEDLARFRRRTAGAVLLMGRITAASVGNHLPGRRILTVSSAGASLGLAIAEARASGAGECFIAGGRRVYEEGMAFAHSAEITRMAGSHRCDVRMPDLSLGGWRIVRRERLTRDAEIEFWVPPRPAPIPDLLAG